MPLLEPPPTHRRDVVWLLVALVLAGLGGLAQLALPLDVGNRAMKATGTPDAAVTALRIAEFGEQRVVLALLEPRGSAVAGDPSDPEVANWLAGLRSDEDILSVDVLPKSNASGTLVALTLAHSEEVQTRGGAASVIERTFARLRRRAPATHRLSLTGQPVGEVAIARALVAEQARVVPAILVALGVLLLAIYRRASLAIAALLPGVGAVGTLGLVEHVAGVAIDPISALLAPVLLTIGVAGAVHVVERHLDQIGRGERLRRSPGLAARRLWRPMVLTALTTIAGFLTLAPNAIPAVRTFGVLAATGVVLAIAWTIAIVPCWLRLTVVVDRHGSSAPTSSRRFFVFASYALRRWSRAIVVVATGLFALLVALGANVGVDTRPERVLPDEHPFRIETERIGERLGGIDTVEVLIPSVAREREPSLLSAAALSSEIGTHALLDTLPGLPRRADSGSLLVTALVHSSSSAEREAAFEWIEERAAARGLVGAVVTGPSVRIARDSARLVHDQRNNVVTMLVVVWIALALGFRSWRLALIGLVPNALPIAALYGVLALLGRPLSASTAMIGSVFLGLVVDDTIHFLHGYGRARKNGAGRRAAVASAFNSSGRAILVTSLVLSLGFGGAAIGELSTTVEFAVMSATIIVIALIGDLVVLPAVLLILDRKLARPARRTDQLEHQGAAPCIEAAT